MKFLLWFWCLHNVEFESYWIIEVLVPVRFSSSCGYPFTSFTTLVVVFNSRPSLSSSFYFEFVNPRVFSCGFVAV